MRRFVILLFSFVIIAACNNDNKMDTQNNKSGQTDAKAGSNSHDDPDDRQEKKDKDNKTGKQYTWTEKEQNKFIQDCRRESWENVEKEKLKDFCSCMLTQAQKYYRGYSQMDEESNDNDDKEIFGQCLANYATDEE